LCCTSDNLANITLVIVCDAIRIFTVIVCHNIKLPNFSQNHVVEFSVSNIGEPSSKTRINVGWERNPTFWWDREGNLLPWSNEQAEQERQRADILAAKLRELGVDSDAIA
jgi:hypothetical protein